LLPTPTSSPQESRTTKRTPSQENGTHGKYLGVEVRHLLNLLPTVRASKANMETEETWQKRATAGDVSTRPLAMEIRHRANLYPTVTARDWKDSPGMSTEVVKAGNVDRTRLDQLPRRLFADLKATTGLKLNPQWCLWFMGYPLDWLKPLYGAWATRSSRNVRKSSSKESVQLDSDRREP
jgi:hypothetical protein